MRVIIKTRIKVRKNLVMQLDFFWITHRLGITAIVDCILVFKNGRMIEDCSHHHLMMAQSGYNAQVHRALALWYA